MRGKFLVAMILPLTASSLTLARDANVVGTEAILRAQNAALSATQMVRVMAPNLPEI